VPKGVGVLTRRCACPALQVHLDDGSTVAVPLGQERVEAHGVTYAVKWAQDDDGRLVVLTCKPVAAAQQ